MISGWKIPVLFSPVFKTILNRIVSVKRFFLSYSILITISIENVNFVFYYSFFIDKEKLPHYQSFTGQSESKYPLCNYYRSFMTFVSIINSKPRTKRKKIKRHHQRKEVKKPGIWTFQTKGQYIFYRWLHRSHKLPHIHSFLTDY